MVIFKLIKNLCVIKHLNYYYSYIGIYTYITLIDYIINKLFIVYM